MNREPEKYESRPLYDRLGRKRLQASLVLALENAVTAFWRVALWNILFAGLWLLQIPAIGGKTSTIATLILYIAGSLWLLWKDGRKFHWPKRREVDRRLEETSKLHHRPLTAIEDKLANPEEHNARTLWSRGKSRALATVHKLKTPLPRPILATQDPMALRVLAVLIVIIGAIVAGPAWKERIHLGLNPLYGTLDKKVDKSITIWVTPPQYTAQDQVILQGRGNHKDVLAIPDGSVIKAQVTRGIGQPYVVVGEHKMPMKQSDEKNWSYEFPLTPEYATAETIEIRQMGLRRAAVPFHFVEDKPPEISLMEEPQTIDKGQIQLSLKVKDDYSVDDLVVHMRLDDTMKDKPLGADFEDKRAVVSAPNTEMDLKPIYDLAWHPWAGLPVVFEITAIDHKKQLAKLPPIHVTLPERTFQHPTARKLITMRKRLIRTPEVAAQNVAQELFDILVTPGSYNGHPVVFLSLKTMSSRLVYDPSIKSIRDIIAQLWDTAIQIEDGNMAMAARDMRNAQRNLEQVLSNPNATQEEINRALDEFREAMANYFQEMVREMQKQMAEGETMMVPPEMLAGVLNPQDLQNFLDELTAQAMSGDKDAARELLSKLQQMMDSMNPGNGRMEMPKDMKFKMSAVGELQKLIEKQEELLAQTKSQAEGMTQSDRTQGYGDTLPIDEETLKNLFGDDYVPPPAPKVPAVPSTSAIDTSKNKEEQEALRFVLGKLMTDADSELGEIPENMGKAELEMRGSSKQLGDNRPDVAIPHQEETIKLLKQAMDQMSEQLAQQLKQMMALSLGPGAGRLDPLGRPMDDGDGPSMFPSNRVKIPDESERKKVREILDSIRRRSGELQRPDYELEYYRRLMQQF